MKNFKCGNGSMDLFLEVEAYPSHIERESSTTLVYYDNTLVGYYTLRHIKLSSLLKSISPEEDRDVLDIARLAVDTRIQGQSVGTKIMENIIKMAIQLNERFIVLDALKEKWRWYASKFNFEPLFEDDLNDDGELVTMLIDLYDEELIERYYEE
ncbi:GNAT family N-acetyltransferase [Paenibacillus sp. E222]|uniref:GNAT family N-acetyltransferase n=1 Tax=Paenibacillus sp. E222 TaxID=2748863 RepID=UPI0015C686DB|nr:GNAT family N-acetyltransferase [Paenibacillus sp. E222]QLG38722.1 GNAT family N-acetyltransferase [Paenibacillus sp. E222]